MFKFTVKCTGLGDGRLIADAERSRQWVFKMLLTEGEEMGVDHILGDDPLARDPANVICTEMMEFDFAAIRIEVAKPRIQRNIKQLRVTFSDQLGTIGKKTWLIVRRTIDTFNVLFKGGMIGLFTGLSLISIVEILYWIYRCLLLPFKKRAGRPERENGHLTKVKPMQGPPEAVVW